MNKFQSICEASCMYDLPLNLVYSSFTEKIKSHEILVMYVGTSGIIGKTPLNNDTRVFMYDKIENLSFLNDNLNLFKLAVGLC